MKQINLLPQSTWIERYRLLLGVIAVLTVFITIGSLYGWFSFLRPLESPELPARLPHRSDVQSQLAKYSINKLKIVGYLNQSSAGSSDYAWSVVQAPEGEIVTVKVGDYLGYEGAQVADIKPVGLYLSVPQQKDLILIRATHAILK